MAGPNLPTNLTSGSTGHVGHSNTTHSYVNKFDTTFLSGGSAGDVATWDGTSSTVKWAAPPSTGANSSLDKILYVSKSGSDSNNGRSWVSAFLTISAALTALGSSAGSIYVGAGTFDESGLTFSSATQGQRIVGNGMYSTFINLASNGTLFNQTNKSGGELWECTLQFGAGVTGTLLLLDNAFRFLAIDVRFDGDKTIGQIGTLMNNNAGDCHFYRCKWESCDVGVQSETSVNYIIGGIVTSNNTGIKGGDPTGVVGISGLAARDITFLGTGDYYIDVDGLGLAWAFDGCWFDGGATTAVKVGNTARTQGPRLFALTNCTALFGAVTSLLLNKATRIYLDNVKFHHGGGTPPTELSIPDPTTVAEGHAFGVRSNQGLFIEQLVPPTWEGYRGYASPTSKVECIESTTYNDSKSNLYRRITIRVNGRVSGDAQTTVTFPSAFDTTQFMKTADSTGFAGMTLSASSLIIPTGVSGSGIIIVEGW